MKYKHLISVMRLVPKTGKYELYMGISLYNKIKSNENIDDVEFVYSTCEKNKR